LPKLSAAEKVERGKGLEPARKHGYRYWKKNQAIKAKVLQQELKQAGYEVLGNTCQTWITRWRKGQGFAKELGLPKAEEAKVEPIPPATSEDIADALLKRVVETLSNYGTLLDEVKELREYKTRTHKLEEALKKEREEKARIIRIHNSQVKERKLVSTEELLRLARVPYVMETLRR